MAFSSEAIVRVGAFERAALPSLGIGRPGRMADAAPGIAVRVGPSLLLGGFRLPAGRILCALGQSRWPLPAAGVHSLVPHLKPYHILMLGDVTRMPKILLVSQRTVK